MKIDRKIRVFISSRCGGEYTVGRKALKAMLEETGLCEVYAFETDYSSSMPVVSLYLRELGESDVIIVFIENQDGVADPVQSEINRARELRKKMIFIFCDERQRKATVLQEQLKESLNEKYCICHEFSDFPLDAYNSFYNDLARQYRFLSPVTDNIQEGKEQNKKYSSENYVQINKESINSIRSVGNILEEMSGICVLNAIEGDAIDKEMGKLFNVLIGKQKIGEVDISVIEKHWLEIYDEKLHGVINCRKDALLSYLSGNYKKTLTILKDIIKKYKGKIPQWMLNDIALDMRNIENEVSYREGRYITINTAGQSILDEDSNYFFNPITDRVNSEFYQGIVNNELNLRIESPDTLHLWGNTQLFDLLSKTFIAAVNSLSITHFLLVRNRIISLFSLMSFEYRTHSLFISVVKMLLLECDEKRLKLYIAKYGESTNYICADDVREIQNLVDAEKDDVKRIQLQSLAFEFFAYYFDDELFQKVVNIYLMEVRTVIEKEKTATFQYVLSALPEMERRVPIDRILDVLYLFLNEKFERWHNDVFRIIKNLGTLNGIDNSSCQELLKRLQIFLLDDNLRNNCPSLLDAAQAVRISLDKRAIKLDSIVKKVDPKYFNRPYSVNVINSSAEETANYLEELEESLRKQNKTQGVGGKYTGYAYNDFATFGNILFRETVDYKKVRPMVLIIEETLHTATQTYEAKFFALRLLIEINLLFPRRHDAKRVMKSIGSYEEVKGSDIFSLQRRFSNQSLLVMWEIAKMYILSEEADALITDFYRCCEAEQIALVDSFCFLSKSLTDRETEKLFSIIWPLLLMLEASESEKIRFLVSVVYSNLYGSTLSDKSINRLLQMLDKASSSMKIGAMSRLKAKKAVGPLIDYIYQQGRVDNNYCVREVANR